MTSLDLDWAASHIEDSDSTDVTQDDDDSEPTDVTQDDEEIRMGAEHTEMTQDKFADHTDATVSKFGADATEDTQDKFNGIGLATSPKIPASEIIVRDIAIERSAAVAALAADSDAAFGQWLAGSGLPSLN